MIVSHILGGLGNQMFQYAAARALAHKKQTKLYINANSFNLNYKLRVYSLSHFNIQPKFLSRVQLKIYFYLNKIGLGLRVYKEPAFEFQEDFFSMKGRNIYLEGYYQSEKYFKDIEPIIKDEFKIITPLSAQTQEMLKIIKNVDSVSLHVRRGDYVTNPNANQTHGTCNLEYYQRAVKKIKENLPDAQFFIFSDDMEWTKENIKIEGSKIYYVDFNDASRDYEDMELMSNCKHNILANSSFSWWGAWLNANPEKIVITPQKWFNTDKLNAKDLIPEDWLKI